MNTKICTSIEQSKKLLSLGLDPSTADMCYVIDYSAYDRIGKDKYNIQVDHYGCLIHQQDNIPAWSLSALLELMPNRISDSNKNIGWFDDESTWWCTYMDEDSCTYDGMSANNPLDAAFEMVCWLIDNDLLK